MKFKIEDINELSDSRQVMESKPNIFTSIFIYILLSAIIIFLGWSWFSEKEIVVKVSGIVKSNQESQIVSNVIAGEVKEINMKNGEDITRGQVLYKIDDTDLQKQKEKIEQQKDILTKDLKNLEKFKESIDKNINYFSDNKDEKEYFYKYKSYESGNKVSIEDKNSLINSKNQFTDKINKLELLSKSINEDKNHTEQGTVYNEQFTNYKISKESLEDKIKQLEKTKSDLKSKNSDKEQLNQIDEQIEINKNGLIKLKSEANIQVENSIEELKIQLKNIESNLNKYDENVNLSKEKNKTTLISQIEEKIKVNNLKIKEFESNIEELDKNIEKCEVKAIVDGKLDIKANIEPGVMIQTGAIIASILPKDDNYKVEVIIPDKDIANIENGQKIKYSFTSLPSAEYGFLEGKVDSLSATSQIDNEKGIVLYTGSGTLDKNILYSNKKEEVMIKTGMTCEARIITRSEKMLYYLLEKLNLKN